MKNKAGFYTTSARCAELGGEAAAAACILQRDLDAADIDPWEICEWHHASGNRLAFFPDTDDDHKRLVAAVKKLAAQKKGDDLPRSKAAVWRGLLTEDAGFGGVDYKEGKYGKFRCDYGEPDGRLYYPSAAFAERAKRLF